MARGRQVQCPLRPPAGLPWLTTAQRRRPPHERHPHHADRGHEGALSVPPAPSTGPTHSHPVPTPGTCPSSSLAGEKGERGEGGGKGKRTTQGLGGLRGAEGGGGLRPEWWAMGTPGRMEWRDRVTRGPGQAVSPERGPGTHGAPSPELKPLFWGGVRPEPGSRAASALRGFEDLGSWKL